MSGAFGAGGGAGSSGAFQVSVSTLTLGTLYEAILSFSRQESLESFWPSVCQNARWLIPSRRMCVVLAGEEGHTVTVAFDRGRAVAEALPAPGAQLAAALERPNTQWLRQPGADFADGGFEAWLVAGDPETLFLLPLLSGRRTIGALLFVMGEIGDGDQAMLNTLGTIYALHVSMSYTLIQITQQQRQMQQQLVMKERMASLGRLVAGLLHEVNTPMGAIASAADVGRRAVDRVSAGIADAEDLEAVRDDRRLARALRALRDNSEVMLEASARISGLMATLRNFVRLDEAEQQRADIGEGLDSALALLEQEAGPLRVERDYGHPAAIDCAPGQLNQAFMNVLRRAVDAAGKGGRIEVRTAVDGDRVVVEIGDDGEALSEAEKRQIFDVSFGSHEGRVRMASGLSVAHHIVTDHGGEIEVGDRPGGGTCVSIRLPLVR